MYLAYYDSSQAATTAEMSMNLADADVMTDAVNVLMIES